MNTIRFLPTCSIQLLSCTSTTTRQMSTLTLPFPFRTRRRTQDISLHIDVRSFYFPFALVLLLFLLLLSTEMSFFCLVRLLLAIFSFLFFRSAFLAVSAHVSHCYQILLVVLSLSVILTDCGVYVTKERNTHHGVPR